MKRTHLFALILSVLVLVFSFKTIVHAVQPTTVLGEILSYESHITLKVLHDESFLSPVTHFNGKGGVTVTLQPMTETTTLFEAEVDGDYMDAQHPVIVPEISADLQQQVDEEKAYVRMEETCRVSFRPLEKEDVEIHRAACEPHQFGKNQIVTLTIGYFGDILNIS